MCNICAHIVNFVYLFCTINTMCYCRLQLFIAQNPFLEAQNFRFSRKQGRAAAVNLQSSYQIRMLVCHVLYIQVNFSFVGASTQHSTTVKTNWPKLKTRLLLLVACLYETYFS